MWERTPIILWLRYSRGEAGMAIDGLAEVRRMADEQDSGLDRVSGEMLEKELGKSSRLRGTASQDITKAGYDLDELARQGYVEERFSSPVTRAVAKLYLTLKDEGASEILEKNTKVFDEQIKKHEAMREDYDRELDRINLRADDVYGQIADLGAKVKQYENGILFTRTKTSEIEAIIFSKSGKAGNAADVELVALGEEYRAKPLQALMREKRELETLAERADERLEPMYVEVKNRQIEYNDAERSRKLIMMAKRKASSEITELHRQKVMINTGLITIIDRQLKNARLAEESNKLVHANRAMADIVRQYLRENFDPLFRRYELGFEDDAASLRAKADLDGKIDSLSDDSHVDYESDKAEAHSILNSFGIY
jgi:hypothetical protein